MLMMMMIMMINVTMLLEMQIMIVIAIKMEGAINSTCTMYIFLDALRVLINSFARYLLVTRPISVSFLICTSQARCLLVTRLMSPCHWIHWRCLEAKYEWKFSPFSHSSVFCTYAVFSVMWKSAINEQGFRTGHEM